MLLVVHTFPQHTLLVRRKAPKASSRIVELAAWKTKWLSVNQRFKSNSSLLATIAHHARGSIRWRNWNQAYHSHDHSRWSSIFGCYANIVAVSRVKVTFASRG